MEVSRMSALKDRVLNEAFGTYCDNGDKKKRLCVRVATPDLALQRQNGFLSAAAASPVVAG